jgi:hypothetical protein
MRNLHPSDLTNKYDLSKLLDDILDKLLLNSTADELNYKRICEIANVDYRKTIDYKSIYKSNSESKKFKYCEHLIVRVIKSILDAFPVITIYRKVSNTILVRYNKSYLNPRLKPKPK